MDRLRQAQHQTFSWLRHITQSGKLMYRSPEIARKTTRGKKSSDRMASGGEPVPGGRSLLFTAKIEWLDRLRFIVVSGTAFGEVFVHISSLDVSLAKVRSSLWGKVDDAHEGAVFGLDASIQHTKAVNNVVYLATCSDDRTIRLWAVSIPHAQTEVSDSGKTVAKPGEVAVKIERLGWCWAHTSRIWKVQFIGDRFASPDELHSLVSAGEDAFSHVWHLNTPAADNRSLRDEVNVIHSSEASQHAGKNIWALDIARPQGKAFHVYTGGADGALKLYAQPSTDASVQNIGAINADSFVLRHSAQINQITPPTSKDGHIDKVRNFAWLDRTTILIVTHQGQIWRVQFENESHQAPKWVHIGQLSTLRAYSVLRAVPSLHLALTGGADGTINLYDDTSRQMRAVTKTPGKIITLLASSNTGERIQDAERRLAVLIITLGSDTATLLLLNADSDNHVGVVVNSVLLSIPAEAPLTSFLLLEHAVDDVRVVVGDRSGNIAHYEITLTSAKAQSQGAIQPFALAQVHEDAVTSLNLLQSNEDSFYILTTSRDGSYKILKVDSLKADKTITIAHEAYPPFGPLIEGATLDNTDKHLILHGFRGNHFVIHDVTEDHEITSVNCKGGHRLWSFCNSSRSDSTKVGSFAWNTNGELSISTLRRPASETLLLGGHGREIKACAILPARLTRPEQGPLIATGAEDTAVRLFTYDATSSMNPFRCISIIRKHNTGIQQLAWSDCSNYLFSCGGSEELFIWHVSRVPIVDVGVRLETQIARLDPDAPDLRVTSFDVVKTDGEKAGFTIAMVLSDSTVRLYRFDAENKRVELVWQGRHTTCCLTQVTMWPVDAASHGEKGYTILSTATDGHLLLWADVPSYPREISTTAPVAPTCTKRIHQNAIKALLCLQLPNAPETRLAVTAGDDNSLAFTVVTDNPSTTLRIPRAHAASITSLALIAGPCSLHTDVDPRTMWLRIASSGNDMRVKIWDIFIAMPDGYSYDATNVDVRKAGKMRTSIADVGCLSVIEGEDDWKRLLVVGIGMEVVRVSCRLPVVRV